MSAPHTPFDLLVLHAPDADAWVRGELLPSLARAGLKVRTAENLRLGDFRSAAYVDLIRAARRVVPGVALRPGDEIRIEGMRDGGETAALDYIEIHPDLK